MSGAHGEGVSGMALLRSRLWMWWMSTARNMLSLLLLLSLSSPCGALSLVLRSSPPGSCTRLQLRILTPPGSNVRLWLRPLLWSALSASLGSLLRLVLLVSSCAGWSRMSLSRVLWLWLGACVCGFALGFTSSLLVFGMSACSFSGYTVATANPLVTLGLRPLHRRGPARPTRTRQALTPASKRT